MTLQGIRMVSSEDISSVDIAKGVRTCLTVGLALACDAVFENGKAAFLRIEELTATLGLDETLVVLKDNPQSIGRLKPIAACSLDGMDTGKLRMMVFQFQMFRAMQHGMIEQAEAGGLA